MERENETTTAGTRCAMGGGGLPHPWWPTGVRYFNFADNITRVGKKGQTPYFERFKVDFDGDWCALGQLLHFRPHHPVRVALPRFNRRTVPGIFLGWKLHPGDVFHGEYYVAALSDFEKCALDEKPVPVYTIKEIVRHHEVRFPLAEARDAEEVKVKAIDNLRPPQIAQARLLFTSDPAADAPFVVLGAHPPNRNTNT